MTLRVLVTGAAGFIGSHTAQRLLERGDVVVGVDNLNTYYEPVRKRANLAEVEQAVRDNRMIFHEGDVRDGSLVRGLLAEYQIDAIVHLGAMAGVRASVEQPALYYDVNLNGTLVLLEAARVHGLRNFVLASTSSAYGNTKQIPFVETDPCNAPLAPYSASKRAAELLCHTYHHLHQQCCTVLRFFTVYGPRGRPDMMAYKVLDNIFTGREVPIYSDGQLWRDWTYVDDIVSGVVAALDRPLQYEIINLGRGQPVLLADFVREIEGQTGKQATLVPASMPETDMVQTYADIGKARRLLGYEPTVSVKEGVARLWEWYREAILQAK